MATHRQIVLLCRHDIFDGRSVVPMGKARRHYQEAQCGGGQQHDLGTINGLERHGIAPFSCDVCAIENALVMVVAPVLG